MLSSSFVIFRGFFDCTYLDKSKTLTASIGYLGNQIKANALFYRYYRMRLGATETLNALQKKTVEIFGEVILRRSFEKVPHAPQNFHKRDSDRRAERSLLLSDI